MRAPRPVDPKAGAPATMRFVCTCTRLTDLMTDYIARETKLNEIYTFTITLHPLRSDRESHALARGVINWNLFSWLQLHTPCSCCTDHVLKGGYVVETRP